jgi:hypothetical protein
MSESTPIPTIPAPALPAPVQRLLGDIRIDQTNISEIDHALPGLEEEITKVAAVLEELKGRHSALGRARTQYTENIRVSREMVHGWCAAHGMLVPADQPPASPPVTCTCEVHEQHSMCSALTGCPCIEAPQDPVATRQDPTETQALALADLPQPPAPAENGGGGAEGPFPGGDRG